MRSMTPRVLTVSSGVASKLSACAPAALAASIAGTTSSELATPNMESSTPRRRAASCSASRCRCGVTVESASAAILRTPGTASIKISCRLPSRSGESRLIPVVLPPGREREATSPALSMSSVMAISGIVRVCCCSTRV
jgi:hypothetical protein